MRRTREVLKDGSRVVTASRDAPGARMSSWLG
eukprot:CAMPEP_0197703098 /NCGR_PEP_ID=MMETSP1338-20131121/125265_1 /TAXON_ID=43686 ORGANISM="Pelagodinium beii, Strain RCC1491" /NCGR_SAMPLE_ID=MMETSP1338 /ASSEMBLY_ACC=CAM_ASM_000754 /LENGTH=31 /DNA_ID= /DNA_START= /DNA_END= /DNA_ORIENTATION=